MNTNVKGLCLTPLREIGDDRGSVLHLLRRDDPSFQGFGECYCSETLPNAVKAWKRHKVQTQNLAVPVGRLKLVVFDDRKTSSTRGAIEVIELGRPDKYSLVTIPPDLWYGFCAIGFSPALIVNCVNHPHDPLESERLPHDSISIPYSWVPSQGIL
jgi:dTDP-4-dehydrorhamnose 3,5-epimerase